MKHEIIFILIYCIIAIGIACWLIKDRSWVKYPDSIPIAILMVSVWPIIIPIVIFGLIEERKMKPHKLKVVETYPLRIKKKEEELEEAIRNKNHNEIRYLNMVIEEDKNSLRHAKEWLS